MQKDKLYQTVLDITNKLNNIELGQRENANKILSLENKKPQVKDMSKVYIALLAIIIFLLFVIFGELNIIEDTLKNFSIQK